MQALLDFPGNVAPALDLFRVRLGAGGHEQPGEGFGHDGERQAGRVVADDVHRPDRLVPALHRADEVHQWHLALLLDYAIAYSDDDARSDLLDLARKFDAHLATVSSP